RNAFPTALKWESETFIRLNDAIGEDFYELNEDEQMLINSLQNKGLISINEAALIIDQKQVIKVVKSLWEKGWIRLDEVLKEKYSPKVERFVKVNAELKSNETKFNEAIHSLKNATKQREILLKLIVEETQNSKPIKISSFLKSIGANHAVLNSMEKKNILEIYELNTSRIDEIENTQDEIRQLTFDQEKALKIIENEFESNKPVLLYGITSSGKTEVYIKLIEQKLKENKTILFLLPEISLTSQMVMRIRKHFGETVGIYHSKFNQNERVEL